MYRVEYKDGSNWKLYHEYKYDKAVGIFYSLDKIFGQGNVRIMNKETVVFGNW